ncbi:MAG: bis(5'-nucleosyl)-tetraphosphatase (symmetrical) YqeK, partial [Clostridia bacterium]|nr:bis(5'-nucleosyl)-tetraphosphatase (symmetrical) YqeK [Clostridia bacterium]
LTNVEKNAHKLWHAISGAAYVKYILMIDDDEIYDAIRYHTTAKADLSLLSKVLYLADYTSSDRDYEDVDVIRGLVNKSLDEAYLYALKYSIIDLTQNGRALHPDTVEAYNDVILKGVNNSGS